MKQRCSIVSIYAAWAIYLAVMAGFAIRGQWAAALAALVTTPLLLLAYVRLFPRISRWMGYGSVADVPASGPPRTSTVVRLYTAKGCPFCPIVRRRLLELQAQMGFKLLTTDVTLRPALLARRGIRSVPVVEVGDDQLVGHVTSQQIAAFVQRTCGSPKAPEALQLQKAFDGRR